VKQHPDLDRVKGDPAVVEALAAASAAVAAAKKAAAAIDGGDAAFDLSATKKKFDKLVDDSDLEAADAVRIGRDLARTMEKVTRE
jgi:hypothetical protein